MPSEVVVVPVLVPGTGAAASQAALNGASGFTGSENPLAATTALNASNTASVEGNTLVSDAVVTDSLAAFEASAALLVADPGDPVWNQTAAGFTVDIENAPTPSIVGLPTMILVGGALPSARGLRVLVGRGIGARLRVGGESLQP